MKIANKPFLVVYKEKYIHSVIDNNVETIMPDSLEYAEFDSGEEVENFINDNNLSYEPATEY